ncbi:MAG: glucosamine-6-phosphate deaminase [bacterium]
MPNYRTINTNAAAGVRVYASAAEACIEAAGFIADVVSATPKAVLGLATGSTPIPVYQELVRKSMAGEVSLAGVSTYNLDEYYPIGPLNDQSYRWFMHLHLFRFLNLPANQAHVLDGTVPAFAAEEHARQFEVWIEQAGGLDLQLLGIGRNGHIGFNEPFEATLAEACSLPTRLVELHPVTRADAAPAFGGLENVPTHALTVGTKAILAAKKVLILAFGPNKADAVAASLQGPPVSTVPASLLQTQASKVVWIVDEAAAANLK